MKTFIVALFLTLSFSVSSVELTPIEDLPQNPGDLRAYSYRPENVKPNSPLVVLLHGCLQNAEDFAFKTGWIKKADELAFTLVMAEQKSFNNPMKCFTWFIEDDNIRDKGEVASIATMIDYMKTHYIIDESKVFVTGISAGATMTASLMASYPELIKATAIVAGVSYGCAKTTLESFGCMLTPDESTPEERGDLARAASPQYRGGYPKVSLIHGSEDNVVNPKNTDHALEQWLNIHQADNTVDQVIKLASEVEASRYFTKTGSLEKVIVEGMEHAWPINTAAGCGEVGKFFKDGDFCLTDYLTELWKL